MDRSLGLLCECAAYPLSSRAALDWGRTALRRDRFGVLDKDSKSLADSMDRELGEKHLGLAKDRWQHARDLAWFGRDSALEARVSLVDLVDRLSRAFLHTLDGHLRVRTAPVEDGLFEREVTPAWRAYAWQVLCRQVCPELLVAAAFVRRDASEADLGRWYVPLAPPRLERVLEEGGVSDLHLHVGAALPAHLLWPERLRPRRADGGEGRRQAVERATLAKVSLLRWALARFLWGPARTARTFEAFLRGDVPVAVARCLRDLGGQGFQAPDLALPAVARSVLGPLQQEAARLVGTRGADEVEIRLRSRDPLQALSPRPDLPAETYLLVEGLKALQARPPDDGLARAFWQYVRARHVLHDTRLLERDGAPGLQQFWESFRFIKPARTDMDRTGLTAAGAVACHAPIGAHGVLELRTNVDLKTLRRDLRDYGRAFQARRRTEAGRMPPGSDLRMGLILHFNKQPIYRSRGGDRPHGYPLPDDRRGGRFARLASEYDRQAARIVDLLRRLPLLRRLLVGIDTCGMELSVPTWVFADAMRQVRERLDREPPISAPRWWRPPGITCHAGEEFLHLAQGMRRVHETVERCGLRAGDRIGHGLAIGYHVDRWCRSNHAVTLPSEERLEDLIWEWSQYRSNRVVPAVPGLPDWLEDQIERLARRIYGGVLRGRVLDAKELRRAMDLRYDAGEVRRARFRGLREPQGLPQAVLAAYLTDRDVYARGREPMTVGVGPDSEEMRLTALQAFVAAEVARVGVVVEACPSSNIVVGDVGRYTEHPMFLLAWPETAGSPPVGVTVNTDDPTTFGTTAANEIAHVFLAMLDMGVTETLAETRIRELLACSRRSSFGIAELPADEPREWESLLERI